MKRKHIRALEMKCEAQLNGKGHFMDNSNLEIKSEFGELVMRQNEINLRKGQKSMLEWLFSKEPTERELSQFRMPS